MDGPPISDRRRLPAIQGLPQGVEQPAESRRTHRHGDWTARSLGDHPAGQSFRMRHRNGPNGVDIEMMGHFKDHGSRAGRNSQRLVDRRQSITERYLDDRPAHGSQPARR